MSRAYQPRGQRRRKGRWTWLFAALLAVAWAAAATAEQSGEYAVKAAFLYNFAKYVQWPPSAFSSRFVIGVIGKDPFGKHLEIIAQHKTLHGARIEIQRFHRVEDVPPTLCQMVFLHSERRQDLQRLLDRLRGQKVLVVADAEGFAKRGAAINFRLVNNKVRFEVNPEAVRLAGLTMSAKLLRLAKIVS